MTSKSFAFHNRGYLYNAWVGKCFPCRWYTAHVSCLLGATHASYRLIHIVCLLGKSCCYGNRDRQCTALCNSRFAQRSLSWKCGFEELALARNKMRYMRSQLLSSVSIKLVTASRKNSFLLRQTIDKEYIQFYKCRKFSIWEIDVSLFPSCDWW